MRLNPLLLVPVCSVLLAGSALLDACGSDSVDREPGSGGGVATGGTGSGNHEPYDASTDRDADDPIIPHAPTCEAAPGGSTGAVQAPTLRATLPASGDENWFASPALVDLEGDGKLEIVAARHSVLYAWKADGTLLWQTAFGYGASTSPEHGNSRMYASPVAGDLDGDGQIEIAVGSDADGTGLNLALYDSQGELEPGWPTVFGNSEVRSIAAGDIDADGIAEILVNKTNDGPATAVFDLNGSFHPGWPEVNHATCDPPPPAEQCWDFGGYSQNIGAGDLDGDGVLDVVSSYDAIGFGIFKGDGTPFPTDPAFTADRVVTSVEAYEDITLSHQGWGDGDRTEFTYSPPVIADIDGDGALEVVLAGDHESTQSTDNQGTTLWVLNPDATRPAGWDPPKDSNPPLSYGGDFGQNIVGTQPAPSVAQLDGQAGLDIVYPSYDGNLYAYRSDGTVLWSYTFATTPMPYTGASEALIVDLNGDGVPEILFDTWSSGSPGTPDVPAYVIILSIDGQELQRAELFGRGSMAPPSVADIDGDGQLELVISLKDTLGGGDGGVQIWDLPGSAPNCVLWGTGRGGLLRQGYVPVN
jgi:hypothetical protein